MNAVFLASLIGFARDRAGLAMTLLLPPLVYLLFAAIFGASASGQVETRVVLLDAAGTPASAAVVRALERRPALRARTAPDLASLEAEVIAGRADVGLVVGAPVQLVTAPGREVAAAAIAAELSALQAATPRRPESRLERRIVGPAGDVQSLYYASAVSVMFVFFAAMHGAMAGLDDRVSGLQARLALLAGGLAPVLGGRFAWLTAVGGVQTALVFALALPRLPAVQPWQGAAWALTSLLGAAAAAGAAMALVAACRSREQAQPLSTALVLVLAALGGSMAPRFLMPDVFRQIGWATPHAWVIEAGQSVLWRGRIDATVLGAWGVLAGVGAAGLALALVLERGRLRT